jgi:hypothetical protein
MSHVTFTKVRREDPEIDLPASRIIASAQHRAQSRRWSRVRNRVTREQNNDYYNVLAMLPPNHPEKDAIQDTDPRERKSVLQADDGWGARSCYVHTLTSKASFAFDLQTNSWISKEGSIGPCATFVPGTLTQGAKTSFWFYVEKTLRTNPKGVLPNGQSCSLYPEHTTNYSWRTTRTLEGCDFIESEPDWAKPATFRTTCVDADGHENMMAGQGHSTGDAMTPEEALRNILKLVEGSEIEDAHALQILL